MSSIDLNAVTDNELRARAWDAGILTHTDIHREELIAALQETGEMMIRSEERLVPSTGVYQAGQARLRKYVITEDVQITVQVRSEELRLEQHDISLSRQQLMEDPDVFGPDDVFVTPDGGVIFEVALHEERPVTITEIVPVQRLRLTETCVPPSTSFPVRSARNASKQSCPDNYPPPWNGRHDRRGVRGSRKTSRASMLLTRGIALRVSHLAQTPPPNADVLQTWVLDSTTELKKLRAAINKVLHGPDAATDHPLGDVPERMVLVATELATNAIRHGSAPTEVRLLRTGDTFVLDVADHDPDTIPEPTRASVNDMGGRGLAIAQSFSLAVGWYSTPPTKHVWATFTTDQ